MVRCILFCIFLLSPFFIRAQGTITGTVFDYDNEKLPLQNVRVRNLSSQGTVLTKASGAFVLPAKTGDLLEFSLNGYHVDTLFLIDLKPKLIRLPVDVKNLKEVEILSAKVNPSVFYIDPYA
ncbi:carboxypeptidase-like regulatory domain-containing protein, partial [Pedobacter sp. BAL39]|uniref:carboxypeptidase-like regulatory domain-containing protein n=1 Tax=Pedobacter sp. BAL39 TaxID=391596 RepID=UPI001E5C24DD